jgi:hypothetical protein
VTKQTCSLKTVFKIKDGTNIMIEGVGKKRIRRKIKET